MKIIKYIVIIFGFIFSTCLAIPPYVNMYSQSQISSGGSGGGIVGSDNFVRANSSVLGDNYTPCGNSNDGLQILNNQAVGGAAVFWVSAWTANTFHNDQYSTITFDSVSGVAYLYACVRLTGTSTTLDGYILYINATSWGIQVLTDGNGATVLGSGSVSPVAGDTFELSIQGTTLTAYHNGTIMTATSGSNPVTDSTYTSGGSAGLAAYNGGAIGNGTTGLVVGNVD